MSARREALPETRVGICCGEICREAAIAKGTWSYALLFKFDNLERYRCAGCYKAETGKRHRLDVLQI
jgi:hypothetical protein